MPLATHRKRLRQYEPHAATNPFQSRPPRASRITAREPQRARNHIGSLLGGGGAPRYDGVEKRLRASLNVLDGHIKNPEIGDGLRAAYTKHRIKTAKLLAKLIG